MVNAMLIETLIEAAMRTATEFPLGLSSLRIGLDALDGPGRSGPAALAGLLMLCSRRPVRDRLRDPIKDPGSRSPGCTAAATR